jgi:hypothetical protein
MAGSPAEAHSTRSASVELVEVRPGSGFLHVRTQLPDDRLGVGISVPCSLTPLDGPSGARALNRSMRVTCAGGVAGASLSITGLGPILTEAIVLYAFADGRAGSAVVRAGTPTLHLPLVVGRFEVARGYVASGVVHILQGYDHLLFLLLLVLSLRRVGAVLLAESAFTLSHSVSFSATALGWIHVSPLAAEACIALSLVLMALDIRHGAPGPPLRGAALALVFGLVHGLGFAGGLTELGVPDGDVALALLGFAGGVEIGQVLFLSGALLALHTLTRRGGAFIRTLEPVAITCVGGLSTYWLVERLLLLFTERA